MTTNNVSYSDTEPYDIWRDLGWLLFLLQFEDKDKGHGEQTWTSALPNSADSSQTAVNLQAGQRDINTCESKATEVWKLW